LSWRDLRRRSNAGIAWWTKLEITPPSFSNHSRYGTRVLVLQRELLPNLSLLTLITRAGLAVVGPFTRVSQARTWIESNRPDAAVLDVVLWDSLAFDLAGALTRRGIPILFYTSWTDTSLIPGELRAMPFLEKPMHLVLVAKLLTRMIADGQVLEIQAEKDFDPNSVSDHTRRRGSIYPHTALTDHQQSSVW
jgi:DNA-binding NtrC family response regulator